MLPLSLSSIARFCTLVPSQDERNIEASEYSTSSRECNLLTIILTRTTLEVALQHLNELSLPRVETELLMYVTRRLQRSKLNCTDMQDEKDSRLLHFSDDEEQIHICCSSTGRASCLTQSAPPRKKQFLILTVWKQRLLNWGEPRPQLRRNYGTSIQSMSP